MEGLHYTQDHHIQLSDHFPQRDHHSHQKKAFLCRLSPYQMHPQSINTPPGALHTATDTSTILYETSPATEESSSRSTPSEASSSKLFTPSPQSSYDPLQVTTDIEGIDLPAGPIAFNKPLVAMPSIPAQAPYLWPKSISHPTLSSFFRPQQHQSFKPPQSPVPSITQPMPLESSVSIATLGDPEEGPAIKRAEQNRAAQRAFRQRKQQYIKWLESKVEELDEVYKIMALVRTENQMLRKLVMDLDERINTYHGEGSTKPHQAGPSLPPLSSTPAGSLSGLSNRGDEGNTRLDTAIGREVSTRLMNLASFPGSELNGERQSTMLNRPKYQPRNSNYKHKVGLKVRAPRRAVPLLPQPELPQAFCCRFPNESAAGITSTATSSTDTGAAQDRDGASLPKYALLPHPGLDKGTQNSLRESRSYFALPTTATPLASEQHQYRNQHQYRYQQQEQDAQEASSGLFHSPQCEQGSALPLLSEQSLLVQQFTPHNSSQAIQQSIQQQQQCTVVETFSPHSTQSTESQFQDTLWFEDDMSAALQRRRYSMPTLHVSIPAHEQPFSFRRDFRRNINSNEA